MAILTKACLKLFVVLANLEYILCCENYFLK